MRITPFLAIAVLAAAAALPSQAQPVTHTVRIEGMQFVPATLTVRKGDRIFWQNADLVPHTATAAGKFDSKTIAAGRSWSAEAPAPGRYDVVCTLHPGMKSVVVVQ
jgi:plastocyanin